MDKVISYSTCDNPCNDSYCHQCDWHSDKSIFIKLSLILNEIKKDLIDIENSLKNPNTGLEEIKKEIKDIEDKINNLL